MVVVVVVAVAVVMLLVDVMMEMVFVIILMIFGLVTGFRSCRYGRQKLLNLGHVQFGGRFQQVACRTKPKGFVAGRTLLEGYFRGTFTEFSLHQITLVLEKVMIAVTGETE